MTGWAVAATLGMILAGCGGSSSPERAEASFCDALCGRARSCSGQCDGCRSGPEPVQLRAEVFDAARDCVSDLGCSELFGGGVESCFRGALEAAPVSEAVVETCEVLGPRFFACGYQADIEGCIEIFKGWRDERLATMRRCADVSCEALEGCLAEGL